MIATRSMTECVGGNGHIGCCPFGPALYRWNVFRPVIATVYRGPVYADAGRVTTAFVNRKAAFA